MANNGMSVKSYNYSTPDKHRMRRSLDNGVINVKRRIGIGGFIGMMFLFIPLAFASGDPNALKADKVLFGIVLLIAASVMQWMADIIRGIALSVKLKKVRRLYRDELHERIAALREEKAKLEDVFVRNEVTLNEMDKTKKNGF